MAAAGLPLALVLGALVEIAAGLIRHGPRREALSSLTQLWERLRRFAEGGRPLAPLELAGAGASFVGAGIVAAASVGLIEASLPLVYLALVLAAGGAHMARSAAVPGPALHRETLLIEPVFLVALGAAFLRWEAGDLDAILGAQEVLGTGYTLGPAAAAVGLLLAAAAMLVGGALRFGADLPARPPVGAAALATLSRWGLSGATVLLVAAVLAGRDLSTPAWDVDLAVWCATAVGGAAALGAARAWLDRLPPRFRWLPLAAAGLAAGVGTAAVVLA